MPDPLTLSLAVLVALFAGFVKGVVGFALPMLMISGLGALMPLETALACLIVPTLVTNIWQALRRGGLTNFRLLRDYRLFLVAGAGVMLVTAQLYRVVPERLMFVVLGGLTVVYAVSQLSNLRIFRPSGQISGPVAQLGFGAAAGFMGGLSGVWGPPTIMMLTAQNTPKFDQMRLLGLMFTAGSVLLLISHVTSGVVTPTRLALSVALVVPAVAGQALGFKVLDRIDQARFRTATLLVLLLSALNLLRRAVMG